jgi:hypothetical protein
MGSGGDCSLTRILNYQSDHLEALQFGFRDKSCKTSDLKNPERCRQLNAREEKDWRIQWLRTRSPRSGTRPAATIHASRRILTIVAWMVKPAPTLP